MADDPKEIRSEADPKEIRSEADPTEAHVSLDLSEYEASIITGALAEFGERWGAGEQHTATYLRERVEKQLPEGWRD